MDCTLAASHKYRNPSTHNLQAYCWCFCWWTHTYDTSAMVMELGSRHGYVVCTVLQEKDPHLLHIWDAEIRRPSSLSGLHQKTSLAPQFSNSVMYSIGRQWEIYWWDKYAKYKSSKTDWHLSLWHNFFKYRGAWQGGLMYLLLQGSYRTTTHTWWLQKWW